MIVDKKKSAASAEKHPSYNNRKALKQGYFFLEQASFLQLHDILLSAGSFRWPSLRAQLQPPVTTGQIPLHHPTGESLPSSSRELSFG